MQKKKILANVTAPFLGNKRQSFGHLHDQIFQSPSVQMSKLWLQICRDVDNPNTPWHLSISELAYLIPKHTCLQQDPLIINACHRALSEHGIPLMACLLWLESIRLQIEYPLPFRRKSYIEWWTKKAPEHYLKASQLLASITSTHQHVPFFCDQRFGVNLVGHAFNVFGIGEYLRMMAKALQEASIPFCVRDIPSENGAADDDRSLEPWLLANHEPLPYAFTIFCTSAVKQLEIAVNMGLARGPHTYSIACWFWEMERWPDSLRMTLELVDEFWPCTRIIEKALESVDTNQGRPIVRIPPVVELGNILERLPSRTETRDFYRLNQKAVLFVFSFDLNSSIHRKNPQAAIDAFQRAFGSEAQAGDEERVGLVIKSFPPAKPDPVWTELKKLAARDARIKIIEASLSRHEILSLFACCDCFLSLHRSEGLGLGPAEALQLGLDVIATGYGGNADFCEGPLAHPIPYTLIPVQNGEYPYHHGLQWADPDIEQAANMLCKVAAQRQLTAEPDPRVTQAYKQEFSAARVGQLYRQRLEELWDRRDAIQSKL
jgi:glycosyltransferase involved in cell wall biosynthesis